MKTPITAEEISEAILYLPVTNGQAESSIFRGTEMIEQYTQQRVIEVLEDIEDWFKTHETMQDKLKEVKNKYLKDDKI